MQNKKLTKQVLIGILAGWAFVFRLLEFPLVGFLKLDFSDIPVLIGGLINGPIGAFLVALIRDVLGYLRNGGEAGIPLGSAMSLVASMTLYLVVHWALTHWRINWTKWQQLTIVAVATISLTLVMSVFNYFIALPLYGVLLNFPVGDYMTFIMTTVIPFNLAKGLIIATINVFGLFAVKRFLLQKDLLTPLYR